MTILEEIDSEYFDDKHNNALKVIERINNKLKIIFTMLSLLSPEPYWQPKLGWRTEMKFSGNAHFIKLPPQNASL